MARFPFFKEVEGLPTLIVGGGKVARHKAKVLLAFGVRIRAVSTSFVPGWEEIDAERIQRAFLPEDLEDVSIVVAATDDHALNGRIGHLAREKGLEVNVIDDAELSTFQIPAILQKDGVTAAVSTGGASPIAAKYLRDKMQDVIPDNFGEVLDCMARARILVKEMLPEAQPKRAKVLHNIFERCLNLEVMPQDEELKKWIME